MIDAGSVFVVAEIQDTPTAFEFDLVTLSLSTGAITRRVNINPGNRGGINFDANYQQQRGALMIAAGEVYATLGGLAGDCTNPGNSTDGYRGYVIAYPETGTGSVQWWSSASVGSTDMEAGAWAAGGASVDADRERLRRNGQQQRDEQWRSLRRERRGHQTQREHVDARRLLRAERSRRCHPRRGSDVVGGQRE